MAQKGELPDSGLPRAQLTLDYTPTSLAAADADKPTLEERQALLQREIVGGELNKIQTRVAWILNNYPETRDSDIHLQLQYWETFEGFSGDVITREDLFTLPRLTSLARTRANIQNDLKLFLASPEIRRRRGTLSEEERQQLAEQAPPSPLISIYADESGKTSDYLIWASVWYLHASDQMRIIRRSEEWRGRSKFTDELHFKTIDASTVGLYIEAVKFLLSEMPAISFKAITLPRRGVSKVDDALQKALYHLIIRGIRHEHDTGRAQLPRTVSVVKDAEEESRDRLVLAGIQEQLRQAGASTFDGRLKVDEFIAVESDRSIQLQLADLFAGSLNRILNSPGGRGPKDDFARFFLSAVGMPEGPDVHESIGDLSVVLRT